MKPLPLGIIILAITAYGCEAMELGNDEEMESLDDIIVYPVAPVNIRKRDTTATNNEGTGGQNDEYLKIVTDKLFQHTRALEQLMGQVQKNEDLTKQLIENIDNSYIPAPEMPEKVVLPPASPKNYTEAEHPVLRLAKSIPKYGNFVKNMIVKHVQDTPDPVALVEQAPESDQPFSNLGPQGFSRRSFDGKSVSGPVLQKPSESSPWCPVAMLCRRSSNPVCGYDDHFGYGKFDDICHMLRVNCYWKYNFGIVAQCKPF